MLKFDLKVVSFPCQWMSSKITKRHENVQAKCHQKSSFWGHQVSSKMFQHVKNMVTFHDIWRYMVTFDDIWVFFMIKNSVLSWNVMTYHEFSWHITNYFREVGSSSLVDPERQLWDQVAELAIQLWTETSFTGFMEGWRVIITIWQGTRQALLVKKKKFPNSLQKTQKLHGIT